MPVNYSNAIGSKHAHLFALSRMIDTANFPKFGALDSLGKRSGKFPNFILNSETARCSGCVPVMSK